MTFEFNNYFEEEVARLRSKSPEELIEYIISDKNYTRSKYNKLEGWANEQKLRHLCSMLDLKYETFWHNPSGILDSFMQLVDKTYDILSKDNNIMHALAYDDPATFTQIHLYRMQALKDSPKPCTPSMEHYLCDFLSHRLRKTANYKQNSEIQIAEAWASRFESIDLEQPIPPLTPCISLELDEVSRKRE